MVDFSWPSLLKGRFIGENIRLIDSVINYTAQQEISGLLLFIEFEKAFDYSLEWSFVNHTLQYFGFGPSLTNWVRTFYMYQHWKLHFEQWPENKVKVLGVWISIDPTVTLNLNYTEKLEQIRNLLSCWKYRRLTLIGKIQVRALRYLNWRIF